MADVPNPIVNGRITGTIFYGDPDSDDVGSIPDEVPATGGTIRFIPTTDKILVPSLNKIYRLRPFTKTLDSNGSFEAIVIGNNTPGSNPVDWTWTVEVELPNTPVWVFNLSIEAGTDTDLSQHPEVIPPSSGIIITKGDPGKGIHLIEDDNGDGIATIHYTDGSTSVLALPLSEGVAYNDTAVRDLISQEATTRLNADNALSTRVSTVENSYVQGDDSRLSDARTPVSHQHSPTDITGSTVIGRQVLTSTDAAAVRTAISAASVSHNHSGVYQPVGSYATLVGGVIPTSQIPAIALTTPHVVANQAAMLALTGVQPGDLAIRPEGTWILQGTDPSILASWIEMSSAGGVTSVNGQTGSITLSAADVGATPASHATANNNPHNTTKAQVGLDRVNNTNDLEKPISTLVQEALDQKQAAGSYATLVGGVIPTSQIPAIALTTPHVVSDESAMLTLTGVQPGDVAIRPDGSWILQGTNPAVLASWVRLSIAGEVASVNGQTGIIVLDAEDIGALATSTTSNLAYIISYGSAAVPVRPAIAANYAYAQWRGVADPTAQMANGDEWVQIQP